MVDLPQETEYKRVPFLNAETFLGDDSTYKEDLVDEIVAVEDELCEVVPASKNGLADEKLAELEPWRMTCDKQVPPLTPIVKLGNSTLCTAGNVTVLSGESKAGKTAFLGAVMAGAIADGIYDGFENVNVATNTSRHAVLHFETEQSESRHQVNHRTIVKRAGLTETPSFFLSYNIRRQAITEYKAIVEKGCEGALKRFGKVFMVFIDGGADFINDVNDAKEANAMVKWMEEIAIRFDCPVIVVVHVNPGSDKERGHLGSQLQRKAESLLLIKREEEASVIEPKLLRNAGIGDTPRILFKYDIEKAYHVSCGAMSSRMVDKKEKNMVRLIELRDVANEVFKTPQNYTEALEKIMAVTDKSISIAKRMFKEMKAHKWILQDENNKKWRLNVQPV